MYRHGLELRSKITSGGFLELFLQETPVPEPAADEIVIRIEAAPLNPSDIILLLGPADPSVVRAVGTAERPRAVALLPKEHIAGLQARLDVALPVGNEGAGICTAGPICVPAPMVTAATSSIMQLKLRNTPSPRRML
jgi:NADPH2:quinone reductase